MELERLQGELVKLQFWVKKKGLRIIVVFEGRDAAGKGGAIKRITEHAPWHIVRSDNKRQARLNCIAHFLSQIPYKELPGEKVMLGSRNKKGAYDDTAALENQKFIPEIY